MLYLHGLDVVHGDLKSGNVLLSVSPTSPYGRVAKVTDFGLSRALGSGQTHRSTHTLGTVSHMAPELLRFGKMSPAVDVFSFGIMSEWQHSVRSSSSSSSVRLAQCMHAISAVSLLRQSEWQDWAAAVFACPMQACYFSCRVCSVSQSRKAMRERSCAGMERSS
eukprot:GHRQ01015324.1.p1 GENE.GHRQ01015324.1~~GHRQ01015324.1.p1  ORF type:complete len:164 (+),score=56.91 GHRQ01015324.1:299-790(+)